MLTNGGHDHIRESLNSVTSVWRMKVWVSCSCELTHCSHPCLFLVRHVRHGEDPSGGSSLWSSSQTCGWCCLSQQQTQNGGSLSLQRLWTQKKSSEYDRFSWLKKNWHHGGWSWSALVPMQNNCRSEHIKISAGEPKQTISQQSWNFANTATKKSGLQADKSTIYLRVTCQNGYK